MAKHLLGETIDIHTGGLDHVSVHHNNEIAQSESATGRPLARYWMHCAFVTDSGEKFSKSLGNAYTLSDLKKRDIEPLALRYLYLTAHYRTPISFSFESVAAAATALRGIRARVREWTDRGREQADPVYCTRFVSFISDDLNTAGALAVLHELTKDDALPDAVRRATAREFDRVLALDLFRSEPGEHIPEHISLLLKEREVARERRDFEEADRLREVARKEGYEIEDTPTGPVARRLRL